jgi:FKBP-type peptidyl-prolyl cis-trans isomerase SlyD
MQIAQKTVASIEYTLTDDDGQVLDSSSGRKPLTYLHGTGKLLPPLETALEGQSAGDKVEVTVPPEQAYGERNEELVRAVPRSAFKNTDNIEAGARFRTTDANGREHTVTVTEVEDEKVTIDANHPLAGKPLNFELKVVDVRDATAEEIENGEVAEE